MTEKQFHFDIQQYQTEAAAAIADIFKGQKRKFSNFTVTTGSVFFQGTANRLDLSEEEILENVRNIQAKNRISKAKSLEDMNFSVEMETGTGKTYVYTKTILELNKNYGFTKFIVVVPSIAIKEGVLKALEDTKEHFKDLYSNVPYDFYLYNPGIVKNFALSENIQIMIITIDSFNSDFSGDSKKSNLMYRPDDKLNGQRPIDLIKETNPVVIIDEPQSVDNTDKAKQAVKKLNPLCQLRYSATHKNKYNLMYKLDAVDAYNQKLVKQISLNSVAADDSGNTPYIKLISVSDKNRYTAKLEVNVKEKSGVKKKIITVTAGDELEYFTKMDYYSNYIVDDIDVTPGDEYIIFTNNIKLKTGQSAGSIDDIAIKRAQIKVTIEEHLKKEERYTKENIKVLSLFFIDEVAKYRDYDSDGNAVAGQYQKIFEEEYSKLINGKFKELKDTNPQYYEVAKVHDGYFSKDKKGKIKNTSGSTKDDESTYELIMKKKKELLSFDTPLRFIFSHSALKEGWDNPNVFQVCTLVENKDTLTKRQKIGRGLRLCVDGNFKRVQNYRFNELTVIPNESYKEFADKLQKEIEEDTGIKFGIVDKNTFADITRKNSEGKFIEIGVDESEKIFNMLVDKKVILQNGKITEEGKSAIRYKSVDMPEEYAVIKDDIYGKLERINTKLPVHDAKKQVTLKLKKEVYISDDFKKLWEKINRKTKYRVNMDIETFVNECVKDISEMPAIKKMKIKETQTELQMSESGVTADIVQIRTVADADYNINYPDPLRYIQDETNITRKTAYEIITKSNKIQSYLNNPQKYLEEVCKIIQKNKKSKLVDGIQYEKIDDFYAQGLFEDDELNKEIKAYLETDAVESKKSLYDYVKYDSEIEKNFAVNMENDDECKLFAKLPDWFKIDTPLGKYNPDWAVIMNKDGKDKLYFVVETKGSLNEQDRRGTENDKITCAKKHFKAIDTAVEYKTAKSYYEDFKDNI